MQYRLALSLVLAATLTSACAEQSGPTAPAADAALSLAKRSATASVGATQTAVGFDETRIDYDWTFSEEVESVMYEHGTDMLAEPSRTETRIVPGDVRWTVYRVNATRNDGSRSNVTGVRGAVCATNNGGVATQGLAIVQQIQARGSGDFATVASRPIDLSAKPSLAAGESYCYAYEIPVAPPSGSTQYRAAPVLTVSNGTATVAAASVAFGAHATVTRDASARIDESIIPACRNVWPSIVCTWGNTGPRLPFTVTGPVSLEVVVDMHNVHVCGETLPVVANGSLTELGPYAPGTAPQVRRSTAALAVRTGDCPPKTTNSGCTLTQGYWKNHAWPQHALFPPSTLATWDIDNGWDYQGWNFFDTGMRWKQILDVVPRGDPYYILAHQYIAAILNQQNGAYVPPQVRDALVFAYAYFSKSPAERALVPRDQLISTASLLDAYNNGRLGVPHCG